MTMFDQPVTLFMCVCLRVQVEKLGLVTTKRNEPYPEEGLQKLLSLDEDKLLDLKTKYSATIDKINYSAGTVKAVHELAEKQVCRYVEIEREYQTGRETPRKVFAFAVTFVINRCHVTLVDDINMHI